VTHLSQEPCKQCGIYGGQAVIEGVMFAGKTINVTAVRRKNQEISYFEVPKEEKNWVKTLKKIPFLRGMVAMIESSAKGSSHLNFSAEMYAEDEEEENSEQVEEKPKKQESSFSLSMIFGVAVAGVISFLFGFVMFTLVPVFMENYMFQHLFKNQVLHNFIEGVIKSIILLIYLFAISQTPLIKRLFQYHGAEHKVISAYEDGAELTPENVQKYSRLHYRCGSSFIILTVIMGIIIYSFVPWHNLTQRVVERIVLLPVVIGVSYETLRFTNALRNTPVLKYLGYPGLWLQVLTTKEPTTDQLEISIASFERMRELDRENLMKEVP
jgi:uncharacterized protein YqhQ